MAFVRNRHFSYCLYSLHKSRYLALPAPVCSAKLSTFHAKITFPTLPSIDPCHQSV